MITVTESVSIAHPIEDVFAFIAESGNRGRWDTTVVSEELTSEPPVRVGSTIHSRLHVIGRDIDFDWRVTAFDPPRRMVVSSTDGPLETTSIFALTAAGDRTELRATIEATPAGMMRFVEPMITEGLRSSLSAGLGRIRAILEAHSAT
ncbi:SRPBCC family protein [Microbacterium sp. P02]|uniref:SRPBCC family protein n=1 Tax=unclassified Microbacterium TaxID=2609290 RepID=UPI003670EDC0